MRIRLDVLPSLLIIMVRRAIRRLRRKINTLRNVMVRLGLARTDVGDVPRRWDKYNTIIDALAAQVSDLRRRSAEQKVAFEALAVEATELRKGYDGYRGAYENCCGELALAKDRRRRLLNSLEKSRNDERILPNGLAGRQLCFMHIGKTAGTSLQHALFEAMKGTAIFHESLENFDEVSSSEISLNDLVIGHFNYQHTAKLRPDRFLLTFLRDPVERVISSYYFLRTDSPISSYSRRAIEIAQGTTLTEFLKCDDPAVRMVTENYQAKAIARDVRPEYQAAIRDLRGEAERNLSSFDFVGIVEHFNEAVASLSLMVGIDLTAKRLNVNKIRASAPPVSSSDIESIRQLNAVDLALYDKARSLFERRRALSLQH
ncbi:sulfotransferase family protein [Bradyrhizobium ontarionense]|uniref:Sulfotransferase family protein n=1 Tax=Bradyrhizobium ontarionense TaxID=2898149 RepID=A0ABY3RI40_9BRAD|nr:sulfotransferase family 2 domain-containing protein [Bradyrhizobium sp. A19]UFZ06408.1 sulfotransferase family protein [Bradyrhizobium sp. A19]